MTDNKAKLLEELQKLQRRIGEYAADKAVDINENVTNEEQAHFDEIFKYIDTMNDMVDKILK